MQPDGGSMSVCGMNLGGGGGDSVPRRNRGICMGGICIACRACTLAAPDIHQLTTGGREDGELDGTEAEGHGGERENLGKRCEGDMEQNRKEQCCPGGRVPGAPVCTTEAAKEGACHEGHPDHATRD